MVRCKCRFIKPVNHILDRLYFEVKTIVMPRSQDLGLCGLSNSSNYQAKILHTSTSALLSLGLIYHCYNPSFILALTRIQPFQLINTSYSWRKSATRLNEPSQIEQMLGTSLVDYLQTNAFPDLVVK